MTLKKYKSKRNFKETAEPSVNQSDQTTEGLHFCIQKHAARRLHYDFRLEHLGVLLSWAVPKGPSTTLNEKRLAIKVEDHPLSYQYFEGVIPKGNYGAGTVEIWDKGIYRPAKIEEENKKKAEIEISKELKEGHLVIILEGEKLHGEYILQKLKPEDSEDTAWLLIKIKPSGPRKKPILLPQKM